MLDFTAFWAGPFATAWLSSMGADVVKVEAVQRPDGIRFSAAVRPHDDPQFYEKSALFHACNLAKRGITLDLGHPDGLAIAKRLVARSDVVAENFTPQVLERFGLDWDTVHALNPAAIMLRMPAFGLDGPWRARGGFAQTMEQLTGMAWVTGYEGGPPIIPGGPVDPMVGAHAALAVVAALEHRARTGEGQLVEVPLVEVATAVTAEQVIRYAIDGTLLDRRGAGGVYRCVGDDAWVAIDRRTRSDDARGARGVVRDPHARRRGARRARRASPRRRWCPGTRRSTIRRCAPAASSSRSTTRSSANSTTRRGRCACRAVPSACGPRPRRPSDSTPPRCCATSSASTTTSSHGWKPSTSSARCRCSDEIAPSVGCTGMLPSPGGSELEDVEDALVDGDVAYQRGTAAAALRHRDFRIVYVGTFASNIGTWMQNVILGEYGLKLTHSGFYVGLLYFGQLGPLLFLSMIGGLLADRVDRRRLLVSLQILQGVLSFALALVAWTSHPSHRRDRGHRLRDRNRQRARRARV